MLIAFWATRYLKDILFYVPLLNTLQRLMQPDDYQAEVLNPHIDNFFLTSVMDSFSSHTHCLVVILVPCK